MPVSGAGLDQSLVRLTLRPGGQDIVERLCPVRFGPLIGVEGWSPGERSATDDKAFEEPPAARQSPR